MIFEKLIQYIQIGINNAHGSLDKLVSISQTDEGKNLWRSRRTEGGVILEQFHLVYDIFLLGA